MRLGRSTLINPSIIGWVVAACLIVVFGPSVAAVAAEREPFDPITELLLGDHAVNRKSFGFVPQPGGKSSASAPKPTCALKLTVSWAPSGPGSGTADVWVTVPEPFRAQVTSLLGSISDWGGVGGGNPESFNLESRGDGQWQGTAKITQRGTGINLYVRATGKVSCSAHASLSFEDSLVVTMGGPAFAEIGKPVTYNITISGGTPPYSAEMLWGDGSKSSLANIESKTVVFSHTYKKEGSPQISAAITDSLKASTFDYKWIEVVAPLTVEINGPPARYTDENGTWVATTTGGYRPKVLEVRMDDALINKCADIHHSGTCAGTGSFSSDGTHRVSGVAVDKLGNMVSVSMDVSVVEREIALSLTGPGTLKGSTPGTFTATVIGGQPPYSFYFYYGDSSWDGPFSTSASTQVATHEYKKAGTFTAATRVEDKTGASVTSNPVTVVVTCPDGYQLCSGECWPEDYQCCGNGACGGDFPVCCGNGCCDANSYCANPGAGLCCRNGTTPVPGAGPGGYICCASGLVACDDGVSCCYP